jgi:hypothetical protein
MTFPMTEAGSALEAGSEGCLPGIQRRMSKKSGRPQNVQAASEAFDGSDGHFLTLSLTFSISLTLSHSLSHFLTLSLTLLAAVFPETAFKQDLLVSKL